MSDARPIGVFDSGLGGLTAVKELIKILPNEDIVYFGDTGRVPYGTRSFETIERYAKEDIQFLLRHDVKMVIAACGTVSSAAPHVLAGCGVDAVDVVSPAAMKAAQSTKNGRIGVIGTQATIKSGSFKNKIHELMPGAQVFGVACPMLVPLVENGWFGIDDEIAALAVERYLCGLKEKNIDTLILGCTHFPILQPVIDRYLEGKITLINTGAAAALRAREILSANSALNDSGGARKFFVSDSAESFARLSQIFLSTDTHEDVSLVSFG
ncbi:MAG: glutamate racemase [Clostridia bacterium]|nr:glutamate racemase [Clostridia bacterium]